MPIQPSLDRDQIVVEIMGFHLLTRMALSRAYTTTTREVPLNSIKSHQIAHTH